MSVFPARSIRPNPSARISDARITPCSPACRRKASSGLSKTSSVPGMPLGMCGTMPAPMRRQAPIGLPVATATAATRRALSIASADRPKGSFVPAACWNARHKPFSAPLIWVKAAAYSLIHSLPCGNV
jgi:hypothetical protein